LFGWILGIINHRQLSSTIDTSQHFFDSDSDKCHHDSTGNAMTTTTSTLTGTFTTSSFVTHLSNISTRATSHVDPQHNDEPITKQQLIEPMVIPNVAGFSVANIPKGHEVTMHQHATMHEFFYVLEGSATFTIIPKLHSPDGNDKWKKGKFRHQQQQQVPTLYEQQYNYTVQPGSFVYVSPPDRHGIQVAADTPHGDVKMLVVGIIVE
jgi:quercetin dioxygenase-like cupin family protein